MIEGKISFRTNMDGSIILEDKQLSGAMSTASLLRYLAVKAGVKFPNLLEPTKELIFEVTIKEYPSAKD